MQTLTREAPLILQIETTNVCNAACIFCAYSAMQRPKGVMSMALFDKLVNDYAGMGGGPVSLTPVVGDALLDPHLLERLRLLSAHPLVNQITMTTNAIALDRYADDEVRFLLESLDGIQVSIGGLDAETYKTLYGVDRFPQVKAAMERLLTLKDGVESGANLTFAFRTNDWTFELRFKRQLDEYRRRGVFVSHIWTYANYSGVIKSDSRMNLQVNETEAKTTTTCVYPCVHMAVCWDGRVTACGCADFEGKSLWVGQAQENSLAELWHGEKRSRILESFTSGRLTPICRQCTAYQADTLFAQPLFRDVIPRQPLTLEYLHNFWGG
ncbi:radical SAM protein [Desulfuromonas soudanensis]|uniref:radical SAM protein n=1 Tax=Desulfuromonas soudanensis TaxID=1603606 RepID=UPI0006AD5CB6|nr:radical SAM protein [Desulfuromonas soudanensis]